METHSGNTNSTDSYFQSLSFPPISTIGQLLGKSNFKVWRSSIEPVLLINPVSSKLILGEWSDARAIASSAVSEQERDEWHTATVATCRFIRATLALNVAPFVRQHNTAKALYLNLIWLYGPEAGIDTQGGPAISPGALMQNPRRTRAGLLAAMESKTPLGESTIPERPPYSHPRPHPHAQAQPQIRAANLGSGLSTTSLLMTTATTPSPSASTADLLRPESQVLPPEVKPVTVIASSVPPPPTVVHVYERMRASPDPSLQTIHEEPHPGTKVDVSRTVVATKTHDVSPVSSSGVSDGDNQSLSPLDDTDEEDMSVSQRPRYDGSQKNYSTDSSFRERSRSIFVGTTGTSTPTTNESSKARKLSFSFPLRKLNKDKKSKGGGKRRDR